MNLPAVSRNRRVRRPGAGAWAAAGALAVLVGLASATAEQAPPVRPWQQLTFPAAAEVATAFATPPPEYAATVTWGWDGPMSREAIVRDLDALHAAGLRAVTIEAGYDMENAPYLSGGWFELVRFAVEQAKARGMRVWIIDEGKYPSGFAGGRFSAERPDLRMQGIALAETLPVAPGASISRQLASEVLGALAVNTQDNTNRALPIVGGRLEWTAPTEGTWVVRIVDRQFRTPVTRAVNDSTRAKTAKNSMGDLLNPTAVRQFIEWTHEAYARHLGDELGTTVLGFRGDEPDFGHVPYTAGIFERFEQEKGYDVRPYLAAFVAPGRDQPPLKLTDEQRRARADYWDIWSALFAQHFFTQQAEWCAARGVEYITHLNNEHQMARLTRSTGDFFRPMRHVQIPGVDSIWNQVWPGKNADFVRLPASAAHVYGRPRALSESFAAYRPAPNVEQARWSVNYQFVRGINLFELMFYSSSAKGGTPQLGAYLGEPAFPALAAYINRVSYLLAQGRPVARIAVYFPSASNWLGDERADQSAMLLARQLLEAQRDFDFIDEQALTGVLVLDSGRLKGPYGLRYRAVIVPSGAVVSRAALQRLEAFAQAGGRVVLAGEPPALVFGRSFREAAPPGPLPWALHEPAGEVTSAVLAALPTPDVAFDQPCPSVKYARRRLVDGDVYFFFNESDEPQARLVTLAGRGRAQIWDGDTGRIQTITSAVAQGGNLRLPLELKGGEARIIVLTPLAPTVTMR